MSHLSTTSTAFAAPAPAAASETTKLPGQSVGGKPIILVAGATGGTGKSVVDQLLRTGDYTVRALVRDVARARETLAGAGGVTGVHPSLEFAQGDVSTNDATGARGHGLEEAMVGVTGIISTIGISSISVWGANSIFNANSPYNIEYRGATNLIDAGSAAGVKNIVMVSSCSVTHKWSLNVFMNLGKWKLAAENHIRDNSTMNYVVVRPAGLKDEPRGQVPIEYAQGDDMSLRTVTRADSATACVASMRHLLANQSGRVGLTFEMANAKAGATPRGIVMQVADAQDPGWARVLEEFPRDAHDARGTAGKDVGGGAGVARS